jgi:PAS domain S-box-containing protein
MFLVEQAPILVWRANLSMGCDYFNDVWLTFTGRSLAQEQGDGWAEGVHPDDLERCVTIYRDHFTRREFFEMEYRLRRHDGVYRWIFDRGGPCHDEDGTFLGYIGSCIDVTERVEAQQALREAQEARIIELQDLLPICSYCKKVRQDQGYWEQIESYLGRQAHLMVSHGICPDCEPKVHAEMSTWLLQQRAASVQISPS